LGKIVESEAARLTMETKEGLQIWTRQEINPEAGGVFLPRATVIARKWLKTQTRHQKVELQGGATTGNKCGETNVNTRRCVRVQRMDHN